mmetsp:Transcript_25419/g.31801  ORF Transcript_25419/g.31801 Transcript_25419/m.31801 type:complete len:112 (+) Transcript_25419:309-644(+)
MPVAAKNMNRALQNMPRVRANLNHLVSIFCSVFRENSKRIRASFFNNELVQLMWSKYIQSESEYIANYLAELINVEGKQSEAYILLKDILVLSNRLNFQILKPELLKYADA